MSVDFEMHKNKSALATSTITKILMIPNKLRASEQRCSKSEEIQLI